MTIVRIPRAAREGELPAVCVVTGATEGARYREVPFQFVPVAARLALGFCGLVGIVVFLVMRERARPALPFTDAAWEAFASARRTTVVLSVAAFACFVIALFAHAGVFWAPSFAVWVLVTLALVVAAFVHYFQVTRAAGPICVEITDDHVVLDLPSAVAADAIRARFEADAPPPDTTAGPRDRFDDELDRELRER